MFQSVVKCTPQSLVAIKTTSTKSVSVVPGIDLEVNR